VDQTLLQKYGWVLYTGCVD